MRASLLLQYLTSSPVKTILGSHTKAQPQYKTLHSPPRSFTARLRLFGANADGRGQRHTCKTLIHCHTSGLPDMHSIPSMQLHVQAHLAQQRASSPHGIVTTHKRQHRMPLRARAPNDGRNQILPCGRDSRHPCGSQQAVIQAPAAGACIRLAWVPTCARAPSCGAGPAPVENSWSAC